MHRNGGPADHGSSTAGPSGQIRCSQQLASYRLIDGELSPKLLEGSRDVFDSMLFIQIEAVE